LATKAWSAVYYFAVTIRGIAGSAWGMMTNAMGIGIAVSGTSLICHALMTGCRNRRAIADHRADRSRAGQATMVVETAGAFPTGSVAIIRG